MAPDCSLPCGCWDLGSGCQVDVCRLPTSAFSRLLTWHAQVAPDVLLRALTTRTLEMRGESILKTLDGAAAAESRDALAKSLYANLFDWLVAAINRKIPSYGALALADFIQTPPCIDQHLASVLLLCRWSLAS